MNDNGDAKEKPDAIGLVREFLGRVWGPDHDLDAIDELMAEDYEIWSGGKHVQGRAKFKEWVRQFQAVYTDARTEIVDVFADQEEQRVVARWINTGFNNGIFGLPADGEAISFTGIAIWRIEHGRLAQCWVERAGLEALQAHQAKSAPVAS